MDIASILLSAAKSVGVSGSLLLAICSHESNGFRVNHVAHDKGSPSYGVCQIKEKTARNLGFTGKAVELNDPKVCGEFAAKYIRYQQGIYGDDWVKVVASYNAGVYNPSNKVLGCPRNLKYIRAVQKLLPEDLKHRLDCGWRKK